MEARDPGWPPHSWPQAVFAPTWRPLRNFVPSHFVVAGRCAGAARVLVAENLPTSQVDSFGGHMMRISGFVAVSGTTDTAPRQTRRPGDNVAYHNLNAYNGIKPGLALQVRGRLRAR